MPRFFRSISFNFVFVVASISLVTGCAISSQPPTILPEEIEAERKSQIDLARQSLRENTQLVADLAWPIVASNVRYCGKFVEYRSGIWLAHEERVPSSWFGTQDDSNLAIGKYPVIWGIAKESPAANSNLRVGDRLLSVAGMRVRSSRTARGVLRRELERSRGNPIEVVVRRETKSLAVQLEPVLTCRSKIRVSSKSSINATANGRNITIHNGLISFVQSEEELQFVIAHELAHNIASHVPKARTRAGIGLFLDIALAGYGRVWAGGVFSYLGVRTLSKKYEREADYLGMYFLANASIDLKGIESFWRRIASLDVTKTGYTLTHPSTPERFILMRKIRDEIEEKRANGEDLIPERK